MENILKYAEDIIISMGGNNVDIEQITEEIRDYGYTTIEEVNFYIDNYYS